MDENSFRRSKEMHKRIILASSTIEARHKTKHDGKTTLENSLIGVDAYMSSISNIDEFDSMKYKTIFE